MGYSPPPRTGTPCMSAMANFHRRVPLFRPQLACRASPKRSSCLARRRTNAVDDDQQSADDELVGKSKNAKSRASKPLIPLMRTAVRFDDDFSRKTNEIREIGVNRRLPGKARVRRSDDCAPRAKAWSPPSSCSDAAPERTCARTDGNAAARPSPPPVTSATPSPAPLGKVARSVRSDKIADGLDRIHR